MLHDFETWALNALEIKLEMFDMVCLRRVLEVNVMDRIRNKDIRER